MITSFLNDFLNFISTSRNITNFELKIEKGHEIYVQNQCEPLMFYIWVPN